MRMIVDTGSTHSVIAAQAAEALGAPVVAKSSVLTSAGEAVLPIVRLDRLTLAGRTATDLLATVVDGHRLDPSLQVNGIIGQDVLASAAYTLDFRGARFYWHGDAEPAAAGISLALEMDAGRFVAAVPQDGGALRLVPDSGADALVLFGASARTRWQPPDVGQTWLDTVAGRVPATVAVLPRFELAGRMLRNVAAAFLPERVGDTNLDGLLPLTMFGRVTIDGPRRRMTIAP